MVYKCPRCGYFSNQKGDIRKHFKRKKLCSAISSDKNIDECYLEVLGEKNPSVTLCNPKSEKSVTLCNPKSEKSVTLRNPSVTLRNPSVTLETLSNHNCVYCEKKFKCRQHKWRHEKICNKRESFSKQELQEVVAEKVAEKIAFKEKEIENKDIIINELKKQIDTLLPRIGNVTNNTINFNINAFGQENKEYIDENRIKSLIDKSGAVNIIPNLLKCIHFNPEHKENWNVCIPNRKKALTKIYNGESWELKDKKETIDQMTNSAYNTIIFKYDENKSKKWKNVIENIQEENKDTISKISKETEIMILNNQEDIVKTANINQN